MIDIDAHHGNGAQAIFCLGSEVLTGSVHVDPGAGWFPHFLGFAEERGRVPVRASNLQPAPRPGLRRRGWLEAIGELTGWAPRARRRGGLVVALASSGRTGIRRARSR